MSEARTNNNLKRKQDESIATLLFIPNASTLVTQLISVRIYNEQTGVSITAKIDRSVLTRVSDFFCNLVENLDEGDSEEIALEEEDVYEAAELLMNIVNFYKKDQGDETVPQVQVWNRSKAILSTKWLVQEYVDVYGDLIKKHIEEMLLKKSSDAAAAIEVAGMTKWSSEDPAIATRVPCLMNGVYDKTDELAGGLPIYSRRGLDEYGFQWIMEYCFARKEWQIKSLEYKGSNRAGARVRCDPPVLPHLNKEVLNVADQDAPGTERKYIAQPAAKVSLVSTPPSADVLLFWEMVGTIFQYVGLMRGPIHSMKGLVDVLSTRKDLRVVEEMDNKVLTCDALFLLFDQLA